MKTKEQFLLKINKSNGCWNWLGYVNNRGYGQVEWLGKNKKAHRLSHELLVGEIPDGLQIDHLCRNRACVNPKHLEIVTQKVNMQRGFSPSATNARKDNCPKCDKPYDYINPGSNSRNCKSCLKKLLRKWYLKNKENQLKRMRNYYFDNREARLDYAKKYYEDLKKRIKK